MPTIRTASWLLLSLTLASRLGAGEPDFAAELPRIPPLSPEEARRSIAVPLGYRVEKTASEPLVTDPVALCFDADGAAYVVEMRDYSEQDRAMLGRVRKLVDHEGDGRFDESTVFAEGLSWPTAVVCWDGGVFVAAPPHLLYLKDENGNGVVEDEESGERRVVYTGFSRSNVQGMANSLRWRLDCRIHGATSTAGAKLLRPDDPDFGPVDLRGRDFSFDPRDLADLRPESGGGQHGMCFDDHGRKFVCSNSDHLQAILYEDRYAARNRFLKAPRARVSIAADGGQAPVFRRSPVEPWRIVRTRLRVAGAVPGPVEGGGKPAGYFTGATGVTVYRGDLMPELRDLAFVADVGSNLVHRKHVEPKGTGFVGTRVDEKSEFLASTDVWFRPVQLANGPDGALHVLDMSREVVEHPKSLPPAIKKHLDLTSGRDRGRLYRVVPDREIEPRPVRLSQRTSVELAALLDHRNAWHRETASRLLLERGRPSFEVIQRLERLVAAPATRPQGVEHAMSLLAAHGQLQAETMRTGLEHGHARVRELAVLLFESLDDQASIRPTVASLVDDPDPRVRLRVAFAAASFPTAARSEVLRDTLLRDASDPLIRFASLSSLTTGAGALFAELVEYPDFAATAAGRATLDELVEMIGRQADRTEVTHTVAAIARTVNRAAANAAVRRLAKALAASKSPLSREITAENLDDLLRSMLVEARELVATKGADDARLAAVRTLALGTKEDVERLLRLLDVAEPDAVQLAALEALSQRDERSIGTGLVKHWPGLSPGVRREAIETLLSRGVWQRTFLDAAEQGAFERADLDVGRLRLLRAVGDPETTARIDALIETFGPGERAKVIERYRAALAMDGDVERGRAVFRKSCATCHRAEEHGHAIGPNLATIRNRGGESILVNVLDPNREVGPEFVEYVAVANDGRQHTGMLASRSASTLVLKRAESKETTLLREDVEILKSSGRSLMPEGIEKDVSVEAMADLLAYLRSLR